MSKMKELSIVLDELVSCGESLISAANALRKIYSDTASNAEPASAVHAEPKAKMQPSQEKKPATQPAQTPKPENTYTKEDVRGILAAKSSAGHSDKVRALLAKFGAKQLKQVDPKDYAALIKEAEVIGDE